MSADSQAQLAQLQEENANLKAQLGEPDLKAFEQIKELRSTNKRLTDEVKRLTGEGVQLAFKNRQLDQQLKKLQQELAETLERTSQEKQKLEAELSDAQARGQRLDHSVEELQGELTQSRERVVSHEAELERQKDELARRQQNMSELQDELTTREGRIAKLEQLVHDFKEQFLSGDDFAAVPTSNAPGSAYEVLMSHLDLALGIPGRTLIDQVYELMELPHSSSDIHKLEELFDTLQDTGGQIFSEEHDQASLKNALALAWEQVSGGAPAPSPQAPAPVESVVEAAVAEEPVAEEPVAEEPSAEEPVANEPVAEEPVVEEPVVEEPVVEEPVVEEPAADEPVADEAPPAAEPDLSALLDADSEEESAPPAVDLSATVAGLGLNLEEELAHHEEPAAEESVHAESVVEVPLLLAPAPEDSVAEEPAAEAAVIAEPVAEAVAEWAPAAAKAKSEQIAEGLNLVSSQPHLASEVLEQALEVEIWVENEAKANLALARIKAGQDDIVPYLTEALPGAEMVYLFEILSSAESTATGNAPDRLALFYQFGSSPRAEVQKQELAIGMGKRGLNRDFVSNLGNEEEEEVVAFLRENLLPKAGLNLPVPSEQFEQRLENTGPAAFVGTLRQALRAVDYTLFDFPELKVLTYDGDDLFLVDASAEPELTLIFHRDIEGMPPEELCFLVFRHLVRMYRGHSQLAHQSSALDDAQRLQLAQAAVELYLEEGSVPHPSLMDRLQALDHQAPEFENDCRTLLLHWYQASDWVGFLYAREFAFRDEVFLKRLDPVADHAAARLVGITAATYGCLREELLFQPELLEEVQDGLNDLFEHGTGITAARMRIQRMWNEFLLED